MTGRDPSTEAWRDAVGAELAKTQQALAASQADLTRAADQLSTATQLIRYAVHLRMHGERAPGGTETWQQFDRDAEAFLRGLPARPTPHLDAVKRERDQARAELAAARPRRDEYLRALGHNPATTTITPLMAAQDAHRELEHHRAGRLVQVAPHAIGACGLCGRPVQRGHAYDRAPGQPDLPIHLYCPLETPDV